MSKLTDLVRSKYPGAYDSLDDTTLEQKVLAKYPMYQNLATKNNDQNLPNETDTDQLFPELAAAKDTLARSDAFDRSISGQPVTEPTTLDKDGNVIPVPRPGFIQSLVDVGKKAFHAATSPIESVQNFKEGMENFITNPSGLGGLVKMSGGSSLPGHSGVQDAIGKLGAQVAGFGAGALGGLTDAVAGTPLNAAFTALTAGESAPIGQAGKYGLNLISKGLSAPLVAEGLGDLLGRDKTLTERGKGLLETAGAVLPFMGSHGVAPVENTIPDRIPPSTIPEDIPVSPELPQELTAPVSETIPGFKSKPRLVKPVETPQGEYVNPETGEVFSRASSFGDNILDDSGRPIAPVEGNEELPLPTNDPRDNFANQVIPPQEPANIFENKILPGSDVAKKKAELDAFRANAANNRNVSPARILNFLGSKEEPVSPGRKITLADQNNLDEWYRYKSLYDSGKQLTDEQMLDWAKIHNELKGIDPNQEVTVSPWKNEKPPSDQPTMSTYILPDGRRLAFASDLTKDAPTIDFTLKDGTIVKATRAPEGTRGFGDNRFTSKSTTGDLTSGQIPDTPTRQPIQKTYESMPFTVDEFGNRTHFHDSGERFTPEEFEHITTHPIMQHIGNQIGSALADVTRLFPHALKGLEKVGIAFDEGLRGVNIMHPSGKKAILINPLQLMKMNNPDGAAAGFIHTILHEAAHLAVRGHDENFTAALANIYEKYGAERALEAQGAFKNAVSDGAGQYHPEVQKLLQQYTEARGRENTAGNLITGEKAKSTSAQIGEGEVSLSDKSDGERTTPYTIRAEGVTPDKIRNVTAKGYKFAGLNDRGDFMFTKGPKTNPVLESEVGLNRPKGTTVKDEKTNPLHEALNLPRAMMATFDWSAPLRQGLGLIHKPAFWKAIPTMIKAWGSQKVFEATMQSIADRPLFRDREITLRNGEKKLIPSFAQEAGLKFTGLGGLTTREESLMSTWLEKVPGFGQGYKMSERAYTAFLNKLRADTFESLVQSGKVFGVDAKANTPLARELASFVNTATGRGSLGRFERNAVALNSMLFSPRLIASRLKYLDPRFYVMASPVARKEAIKSALAIMAAGNTFLTFTKMAADGLGYDADIETDPNSADYGKMRIGNVRMDPWGGFQQYLVFIHRMLPEAAHLPIEPTHTGALPVDFATGFLGTPGGQIKSSNTGRSYSIANPKFGRSNRFDTAVRFVRGKLNPAPGFAASVLAGGQEISGQKMNFDIPTSFNGQSVNHLFDNSVANRFIPLVMQDIRDVYNEDPSLVKYTLPFAGLGMGLQAYDPSSLKKFNKGIYQ